MSHVNAERRSMKPLISSKEVLRNKSCIPLMCDIAPVANTKYVFSRKARAFVGVAIERLIHYEISIFYTK